MKKRDIIVYLFKDIFASFRGMKIEMVTSLVLHVVVLALLLLAGEYESSSPQKTIKTTAISVVAAPLQRGTLERTAKGKNAKTTTRTSNTKKISKSQKKKNAPKKTSKVPDPKKKEPTKMKEPEKEEEIKKEDPKKETPKKETKKKDLEKKPSREELLRQLQSPNAHQNGVEGGTGEKNRSPDGSDNPPDGPAGIGKVDPILAKYIQDCHDAIFPNWAANTALIKQNPELRVTIKVIVAEDGTMSNPEIITTSENRSFDRSATMAMFKTQKLPPPPPQYRQNAKAGVFIALAAKDKL